MILNASFFGQLKIKYNNKIVSPATDYVLSDLTNVGMKRQKKNAIEKIPNGS